MHINKYSIKRRGNEIEEARRRLESSQLKAVRELLPDRTIEGICEECNYLFRTRLFTPLITIFHMLGAAISREGSFQSAWHNEGETGRSDSLSKARKRLPLRVWKRLSQWVVAHAEGEFKKNLWRGHRVIGVDGACVSMSDEKDLERAFGKCGSRQGRSRFPIARMVIAVALHTMLIVSQRVGPYRKSENAHFSEILEELSPGDVIVADRRYAGAKLYVEYMKRGIEFITRAHQRLRVEKLRKVKVFSSDDFIADLHVPALYRQKDPKLPETIKVRAIRIKAAVRGRKEMFWLITSLVDERKYPAGEIRALYKKRWKMEGLIREIKIWLGADVLRSKTVEGIHKELYAKIIACNLIHWLMLKSAEEHRADAERISFSAAVRLTASFSLKMSCAPYWKLPSLYKDLLERVACSAVPHRPGRNEPRLKKRDQKHYGILKISRAQWRAMHTLAA